MFLATKGDARDVLWNVDPADFSDNANCLSDMMDMLKKEFDRPEWEKADHAAEQFEKRRRAPGEKMIAHLHNIHRTYTKMLKEDKGTTISDTSMARRILRRSNLSADEQRQVLSSCGHVYDMDKIKDALRLTYGDAHKADCKRPFATRDNFPNNNNNNNNNNNDGKKGGGKPSWRPRKYGANHVDPDQDQDDYGYDEEDEEDGGEQDGHDDHVEAQDEDEDAEQDPEAAPEDADDQDEDEDLLELSGAFVQFMRAGKKMSSKSKGWKKPPPRARARASTHQPVPDPQGPTQHARRRVSAWAAANTVIGRGTWSAST